MIVRIEDPEDARIEPYRQVRERDLVGREGRFIAEGEVVLRTLVSSPLVRPVSLLVAEHRLQRLEPILERLDETVPVYAAGQGVLDAIAGFPLHRGLLGIGERTRTPTPAELLAAAPERALVLALFGIGNHDNMGGLFRNAAAFGADAVVIDADCCDPLYRKAIRVSVGAALTVPFARGGRGAELAARLQAAGFSVVALSPRGEIGLAELSRAPRTAVLFGAEGPGLPPEVMANVRSVRIEMAGGFDSLNVATTSGIVLHHLVANPGGLHRG